MNAFLRPLTTQGRTCSLVNVRTGMVIASVVEPALDSRRRRKGLLGRDGLDDNHALVLAPCVAVHTIGMRFPIDVLFVAADGCVVKIVEQLRTWRIAGALQARITVELAAGVVRRSDIVTGDRLSIQPRGSSSAQS
jgi:uncharacterized membrane protein (UPF0127 family)